QQPVDLGLKRIERRPHRPASIDRWLAAADRPADRVAMQPRPATDLALRQTLDEVQPTDLGPLLHPDHLGPPELALRRRAQAPKATGQHAQVAHFSTGAGGPVFTRRRHRAAKRRYRSGRHAIDRDAPITPRLTQ